MKDFKKFTDDDFDVNKFIEESWEKIEEISKRFAEILERHEKEEGKYVIVYNDIED